MYFEKYLYWVMDFIKRKLEDSLNEHLEKKEITLILGPRQAGKTTMMRRMKSQLEEDGKSTLFLNLDIDRDWQYVKTQSSLVRYISAAFGDGSGYVFIDEIQRKQDAGRFLKGIYDMDLPYKFIVSGSGSLELKENVVESLAGRKRIFELNPISYIEFLQYKTDYQYEDRIIDWLELTAQDRQFLLEEYLIYGGYPDVVKAKTREEKILRLEEIYRSYIERDINSIINIDKPREFGLLFQYLAHVSGYPLNYSGIGRKVGLSDHTVKQYFWYLEKTYMIELVRPFFQNPQKEIVRAPSPYFIDLGIRSFMLQQWMVDRSSTTVSMSFRHLIGQLLKDKRLLATKLNFWRTKNKAEVDFITGSIMDPVPYEVKFSALKKPSIPTGLKQFIRSYHPKASYVVNLELETQASYEDSEVFFVPYYKLISPW